MLKYPSPLTPPRSVWTAFGLVSALASSGCGATTTPKPSPVTLTLLAAGATAAAVTDEIEGFEAKTGLVVKRTFGAVGLLRDAVLAGTPADVVIVSPAIIATLDAQHIVLDGSRVDLGQVGGGIAVRAGTTFPAITSPDDLKQTLLHADEVYYADPAKATAGAALMKICDTLGIGAEVRAKGHPFPGGKEAMQAMARSKAATVVGATQISEILSVPEVKLVGGYPSALQVKTTYSAIILKRSALVKDAQQLVQFFVGPAFQARLARSGFEPVAAAAN